MKYNKKEINKKEYDAVRAHNNPEIWLWDVLTLLWMDDVLSVEDYSRLTFRMFLEN